MTLDFKVFPKQREALNFLRDSVTNDILYGGGARGGKSYLGCGWVVISCFAFPGSSWMIAREELTKLKDTTLLTFFAVLKDMGLEAGVHYNFNASTLICEIYITRDGERIETSRVFFREIKHIPSDPQFDRLGSYDLTGAFIDEAQQIHPKAISVLRGRFSVLQKYNWRTIPKMLFTCNPAKNWIYSEFVKPDKEGTLPPEKRFVRSLATDNPYVSEDYIENLKRSDKVTVERLLYGNFDYDDDPGVLVAYDEIMDMWNNPILKKPVKYMSVDVARFGNDSSVQLFWNDWEIYKVKIHQGIDTKRLAQIIDLDCKEEGIPRRCVIIDEAGVGGGVCDQLRGVMGFIGASTALENENARHEYMKKQQFKNLRAQCIFMTAQKIKDRQVSIKWTDPTFKDKLSEEIAQWRLKQVDDDEKRLQIISKEEMKEHLNRSPDFADALFQRYFFELKREYRTFVATEDDVIKIETDQQDFDRYAVL